MAELSRNRGVGLGPAAGRILATVALLPIVPAVSMVGIYLTATYVGWGRLDELRWFHLFFAAGWVCATVLIWRRAIVGAFGRSFLTAIVSLIPFMQVVYGQPLWGHTGCMAGIPDSTLRVGQHQLGVGLYVWLSVWVWWGLESAMMASDDRRGRADGARIRMTPVAKNLVATIGSVPFLFGVFCIAFVVLDDLFGLSDTFWQSFAVSAVVAVGVWILIWRGQLSWTRAGIVRLVVAAVTCLGMPIALNAVLVDPGGADFWGIVGMCLPLMGWGAWMVAAAPLGRVGLGRMPADADELGPRCLKCGYLLRGLRSTRCPECGDEPTLDELWAASASEV